MKTTAVEVISREELAEKWAMSPRTLANWALIGKGPTPRRFGRRAFYRMDEIEAFEREALA